MQSCKREKSLVLAGLEPVTLEGISIIQRLNHCAMLQLVFEKLELIAYECKRVTDIWKIKHSQRAGPSWKERANQNA